MRILNVFNDYLERGGEAQAVDAVCESLSGIYELERADFSSSSWISPTPLAVWRQAICLVRNPSSLNQLRNHQTTFRADLWLVHNVVPVASLGVYPEARKLGVPLIQYIHNFRPFSVNGYLWARDHVAVGGLSKNYWEEVRTGAWQNSITKTAWLAMALLLSHSLGWWKSVSAWIAISEFMRQKFISAGIPSEKIFTLRHFWRPRSESTMNCGDHYLFIGRLTDAKGIEVLLEAWGILERERGTSCPKLIIAGDGPSRSGVESRTRAMKSVEYVGSVSGNAKDALLRRAIAVVVPSISWEALGLIVYEAYDYSLPVLVARSGGLPEITIENQTGLVHEPGDASQLAEQVMTLARDRSAAREMGNAGRRWLLTNANEEQWQTRFADIVNHVLK